MRQITENSVDAFYAKKKFNSGNTIVDTQPSQKVFGKTVVFLKLFGNIIACLDENNVLSITSAGWKTSTTKERLNALQNVRICQKKGIWYLNGEQWNGEWKTI